MASPALAVPTGSGRRRSPAFRHHLSHRSLLRDLAGLATVTRDRGRLDAVAVPASRCPHNLLHAARTARLAQCHLLVLCSRRALPRLVYWFVTWILPAAQVTVARIPREFVPDGLTFKADSSELARERDSDTGLKRNLAIAVARMCGWKRLLFLDDDVRGFGSAELAALEEGLADRPGGVSAVAWSFDSFPDNSIVCHAYRRIGEKQKTFVGGGALAVRTDLPIPHFPLMYNEDWLFMLPLLDSSPSRLAHAGALEQTSYDPYRRPHHATLQEAGDLIGEALFGLLHRNEPLSVAVTHRFWRSALSQRRQLVTHVRDSLAVMPGLTSWRARRALDRVLTMDHKGRDRPRLLASWVLAWQGDLVRWKAWLDRLQPAVGPAQALRRLGVRPHLGHPLRTVPPPDVEEALPDAEEESALPDEWSEVGSPAAQEDLAVTGS